MKNEERYRGNDTSRVCSPLGSIKKGDNPRRTHVRHGFDKFHANINRIQWDRARLYVCIAGYALVAAPDAILSRRRRFYEAGERGGGRTSRKLAKSRRFMGRG